MMEFHLLGPVRVVRDGAEMPLSGSKAHTMVAALVLADERVVSDDRLSELLWGENPPSTMSAQIYTYVSRLRKLLGPQVGLARRAPGYALSLQDASVDAADYRRLDRAGRAALADGRYDDARRDLTQALALFSGPVLGNTTESLIDAEAGHWEEQRLETEQHLFETELLLGHHHEVVADLARALGRRPLCEQLRAQYMTALYRCGRQADALAAFHDGRQQLADDLGVDPGPDLVQAYESVLHNTAGLTRPERDSAASTRPVARLASVRASDRGMRPTRATGPATPARRDHEDDRTSGTTPPVPTRRAAGPTPAPSTPATPAPTPAPTDPVAPTTATSRSHSLPLGAGAFVGRTSELAALDRVLAPADRSGASPSTRRCLVTGLPGVGKTALVVRAAYRHHDDFDGGHVYAALAGPDGAARPVDEVLTDLLFALGAPPVEGADLATLTASYRALTASRRVLVLLDDVRTATQVETLLPAGDDSACLLVGPAGLAAAAGAAVLCVEPLSADVSVQLLGAIVGPDSVEREPEATARLVAQCAGVPLALRAVAGRLAARPGWALARCADVLERPDTRLTALSAGDLDVARAFAQRWRAVTDDDARDVTRLAALDGELVSLDLAADVLDLDLEAAEERLAVLAGRALVEARGETSYRINPLLRLFVLFHAEQPAAPRRAAVARPRPVHPAAPVRRPAAEPSRPRRSDRLVTVVA